MRLEVSDIKAMLIDGIEGLARELAPDGVRRGLEWSARNPMRVDRRRGSFVIRLAGPKPGSFVDYAADLRGDVIDLVAYMRCGALSTPPTREQRIAAIRWAKDWLHLEAASRQEIERAREESLARMREAQALELEARRRRRNFAREIFVEAEPIEGSLADRYLASRGIELAAIPNREASLRFARRLRHWMEPHVGPAMVAIFRNAKGSPTGIHATFLREDGRDKCTDLEKAKLMLGEVKGSVIRLTKGASGLTPEEAIAAQLRSEPLVLAEGIENGLSAALGGPQLRTWAVGSLGNLAYLPKLPFVHGYIVCADNDWGKPGAVRALERAIAALEREHRRPVVEARSYVGKDLNDLVRRKCA